MSIKRLFMFLVSFSLLLPAIIYSQEKDTSRDSVYFDFVPGESSRRLSQMKAGSLARRFETEKLLTADLRLSIDQYDVTYYDIFWRPNFSDSSIYGEVTIHGRSSEAGLDRVVVFLHEDLHVDTVFDDMGRRPSSHQGGLLTVYLDHPHDIDEEFSFTVIYEGYPPTGDIIFEGLYFTTHHGVPIAENLSEPFGARNWWPCKDVPWDKADSSDVRIECDTSMTGTSNGLLISDTDNGDGTHTMYWRSRYPITTYNICLAVTNFVSSTDYYVYSPTDSMPIVNYIFPEYADDERIAYGVSPQALTVFADLFGEYPFINEKFGHSMCNIHGMEHQTNVFLSFYHSCDEPTVVHELAHHWWGNLVTLSGWEHIWLQEGIGTYAEPLFYEAIFGPEHYRAYMEGIKFLDGGTVYVYDITEPWVIFDFRSYWKGAWVTHMLRGVLGDEAFFGALQEYLTRFAYGNASSDDMQEVMEEFHGQDLDYYFQEWLHGEYYPDYRYSYFIEDDLEGGSNVYLHIRQRQTTDPQVFTMPIHIHLQTDGGEVMTQVFNDKREQCFCLHSEDAVDYLQFDPYEWILRNAMWEEFGVHIVNEELDPPVQVEPYECAVIAKGGSGEYTFGFVSGEIPEGWVIDSSTGVISGVCNDGGEYTFEISATDIQYPQYYADTLTYTVTMGTPSSRPGDANADGEANVGDAVYIINYVFKGGPAPVIMNWSDVNNDCQVNVGDAVYLIQFVFGGGPEPQPGCVE